MADDSKGKGEDAPATKEADRNQREAAKAAQATRSEPTKYTVEEHMAFAAGAYGQRPHVIAGAVADLRELGVMGDDGYTKDEMAGAIDRFLGREIKTEGDDEGAQV